jgi:hypothetical protein
LDLEQVTTSAGRYTESVIGPANLLSEALAPAVGWPSMKKAEHFVQFYETDDFIARSVSEYFTQGLNDGDICISVASPKHQAAFAAEMVKTGADLNAAQKEGRFITLDARETLLKFMKGGMPDRKAFDKHVVSVLERAQKQGHVRIYGEMVGLLMADRMPEACAALEGIWEDVCHEHSITLFCGYPLGEFAHGTGSEAMIMMCGHHSRVIPSESYTALESPDDRMRAIALLQQRGHQLEAELAELRKSIAAKA